ncbi:MAG: substrate-binding domain-containing protein [Micrococcales bacterium]|nr:substrate-binding domain-containing protein [Micrococcales bacterium]
MKKVKLTVTAAAAVLIGGMLAAPASADPAPQTKDYVGVGSDTTQIALNAIADGYADPDFGFFITGYNAGASARVASFDATNPLTGGKGATEFIQPRVGVNKIVRPDGSGAGKVLLYGASNNSAISFARSSSALNANEVAGSLVAYPFAVDEVAAAVAPGSSYAPAGLTPQQLVGIYEGTITNWSQVGGANVAIVPLLPQSGSGTRTFFLDQLALAKGSAVNVSSSVISDDIQEHDPSVFVGRNGAVVPFSVGRADLAPGSVKLANVGAGAFDAKRGVYNVVRGSQANQAWATSLFGSNGYLCSSAAKDAIAAGGLTQLASPGTGECGVPYTTTAGVTNFATS